MKKLKRIRNNLIITSILAFQTITLPVYASPSENSAVVQTIPQIDNLVANLTKSADTIGMRAGIAVYNTKTGELLDEYNADKTFVPASNLKLHVTAAALDKLGPNYQFQTEIYTTGTINKKGVLKGDVSIKGYGDPSLSENDLQSMANLLKNKGIKAIQGDILVDESYYDNVRLASGWMWDDETYGYSAQISALAVHENMVNLSITANDSIGKTPVVNMYPANNYLEIQNNVKIVEGSTKNISIDRPRGTNTIVLNGTIGKDSSNYTEDVTVENPSLFAGFLLKKALQENGIDTTSKKGKVKKTIVPKSKPIIVHNSKPISELILQLNKESDNFYAEMLLKKLGAVAKNEGSFDAGVNVIKEYLKKGNIDTDFIQVDGSGLSRMDLVSPRHMAKLLNYVNQQNYNEVFERSLPIAGVDGTLKSRMLGTDAENNVHAKTGSMSGVNSLSGYVKDKNGDKLAFSIFLNGVRTTKTATNFQDAVSILLSQYPNLAEGDTPLIPDSFLLSTLIDPILDQENLKGVTTGIVIGSLDRNYGENLLYQRNADDLLTPASNLKLLTSTVALKELGPTYTFQTELYLSALPDKHGKVNGDVIVKGYGDPTLQSHDPTGQQNGSNIKKLVDSLAAKGISQINGNIIIDESQYDLQRLGSGWAWDDEAFDYNAPISALSINRSAIRLNYQPSKKIGIPVDFNLVPKTDFVQIINESKTVSSDADNTFSIEKERGKNIIHLKGDLPLGEKPDYERIAIEEPSLFAGTIIKDEIEKSGIKLNKRTKVKLGIVSEGDKKITQLKSPPLSEIINYMNKNSDNFYAEMLLKQLGSVKKGEGSASAGAQVVKDSLRQDGIDTNFSMADGSGLSRYNMISAKQIAALLKKISNEPFFSPFYQSLPIAGFDGTLKDRMKQTPAEFNLHAKTGTLTGVSGLSGYVRTKDGEHLYFSILMNGYTSSSSNLTDAQNKIGSALAELSFK